MRDAAAQIIYLKDYRPVPITVHHVELTFHLSPNATKVQTTLHCARQSEGPMVLNGEGLKLLSLTVDGSEHPYDHDDKSLTLDPKQPRFTLETLVEIDPQSNTALDGLYMSNGMYCTQCEAEGFRKITYMLDRPDVMATYRVRIESDQPVLLSNGNPAAQGPGWADWDDPHPKPTYLFALVAGDLRPTSEVYTTSEQKNVTLNIWVRPGDEGKTAYAMDALKRSMRWDEEIYGRTYDLDVFNIVAVDDFNMGAMENKGLNIFNSKYVLASPETATDQDYAAIESIVAHEYFHNWTGNRITCRDWFQLCLKEGLTVFRDQQFSADMRSAPVQRIKDVLALRSRQFREDAGPLAHPVRPESFVEINNFYTATVYEKGAEVIAMLRHLVGPKGYRRALSLYFDRHDGQACTIEDWLQVFEDACGRDLTQFKRWYTQAGTPRVSVSVEDKNSQIQLTFRQKTPPTPGQTEKAPYVIPILYGLLSEDGQDLVGTQLLEMTSEQTTVTHNVAGPVVPSILRGFSAPVILDIAQSDADKRLLLAHDTDPFNRWEAARSLAKSQILATMYEDKAPDAQWLEALRTLTTTTTLDPAFRALCLALPAQDDLAQTIVDAGNVPDPDEIYRARQSIFEALGLALGPELRMQIDALQTPGPYTPDAKDAGKRALKNTCLRLLAPHDGTLVKTAFESANNMTDQIASFAALLSIGDKDAAQRFEAQWGHDRLVMDKWFMLQITEAKPPQAVPLALDLTKHLAFEPENPNRFRAVIGGLISNPAGFHTASGAGYRFLADWLLWLDPKNPQTAARMSTAFETWRRYDPDRQGLMQEAMQRMQASPTLSDNLNEMLTRMLDGTEP